MKYKKSTHNGSKKVIIVLISIIAFALISLMILEISGVINLRKDSSSSEDSVKPVNTINYDPPTEEEKTAGDKQKQEIIQKENEEEPKTTLKSANVIIVDASQYSDEIEVRAFASNVLENGTCNYSFSLAGQTTITKETTAYADASTTPCITLTVPRAVFAVSGEWQLTVAFSSANYKGSATQKVVIK